MVSMTSVDTRSLLDRLAERLYAVDPRGKGTSDSRPWQSVGHPVREPYLVLAAEVLRQMTWNWRMHANRPDTSEAVTLAPNDWTP